VGIVGERLNTLSSTMTVNSTVIIKYVYL